jgi:LacI family transcriptional regulator
MSDIARRAGVSPMTVSRVVNGDARVRDTTREKVEKIIRETGYVPDPAARILARAGAGRIGLIYANPSDSYLADVLSGALEGARSVGLLLLIEPSKAGAPDEETEAVRRLAAGGAQGVIVPPPLGESAATLDAIKAAGLKAVLLAAPATRDGLGAEAAVRAVDGAVLIVEAGDFTYRSGFEATRRLLNRPDRPSAVFASNDDMAAGALAAVHAAGLSTPGDVSVAGFDDSRLAASVWPALTTIRQPTADMARRAAVLLGRGEASHGPVPHQLILRESTASVSA